MSDFWTTWRKEILRGSALFFGVLAAAFVVRQVVVRVRQGLVRHIPVALRDLPGNLDADLSGDGEGGGGGGGGGARVTGESWSYSAPLAPKQAVWIHNINGSVHVVPSKRQSLQVTAVKSYHHSDPAGVRFVTQPYDGGVAICAVWQVSQTRCEPGEHGKEGGSTHGSDVAVDFTVHAPRGVRVGVTTVNGSVHALGLSAPLDAVTVRGDVDAETALGPVQATSVDGSVRVRIRAFGDTGAVALFTVNGSVTAELPAQLDAEVEATTVNGSIDTDYPLTVSGKYVSHSLRGTVGQGGRRVHLVTVNGGIALKRVRHGPPGSRGPATPPPLPPTPPPGR